ncbi:hypothetical protein Pmani_020139 [Petrolisthes manimaculis]|uniref:Uncharacterized protein n=1 Tax=Petrolisthes manimaculis TaxID=1843537 RepID=A0AAE1PIB3_9EUCA|nr:hypothetical protein Pmani_020139 [Petrolisthes manimaculis]
MCKRENTLRRCGDDVSWINTDWYRTTRKERTCRKGVRSVKVVKVKGERRWKSSIFGLVDMQVKVMGRGGNTIRREKGKSNKETSGNPEPPQLPTCHKDSHTLSRRLTLQFLLSGSVSVNAEPSTRERCLKSRSM